MKPEHTARLAQLVLLLAFAISQSACIAVGYRSGGGWFVWPGGLGLLLILFLLYFMFGRGR